MFVDNLYLLGIFCFLVYFVISPCVIITKEELSNYPPPFTQKTFNVEFWLKGKVKYLHSSKPYKFFDKDRFEVNEMYFDFLESPVQNDIKKSVKSLKAMIQKDSNFFDPYITLHEYYLMDEDFKKSINIIELGLWASRLTPLCPNSAYL